MAENSYLKIKVYAARDPTGLSMAMSVTTVAVQVLIGTQSTAAVHVGAEWLAQACVSQA